MRTAPLRLLSATSRVRRVAASPRVALLALLSLSCDWSDFDEYAGQAPVAELKRPSASLFGFGASVTSGQQDGKPVVLVSGAPGVTPAALFVVGSKGDPSLVAETELLCADHSTCLSAVQPAAFRRLEADGKQRACFAYAWDKSKEVSVLVSCDKGKPLLYPVPAQVKQKIEDADLQRGTLPLVFGADRSGGPLLVAAAPAQRLAWLYPSAVGEAVLIELPAGGAAPKSFGEHVAVLRPSQASASEQLFAVSAPSAGQVWLFRFQPASPMQAAKATAVACVGSRPGFGRSLAAGDVNGDAIDDLVVSDEQLVSVISGAALMTLPPKYDDSCAFALPPASLIASFGCGSGGDIGTCEDSEFGRALAVADLDGDGDGEVAVGAPAISVRGEARAGAVLIYDVEGADLTALSDVRYLSSANSNDAFGTSIAAIPQGEQEILVAGGPTKDRAAILYCSSLLKPEDRVGRCAP